MRVGRLLSFQSYYVHLLLWYMNIHVLRMCICVYAYGLDSFFDSYVHTVQIIKKFPLRNCNMNLLRYIYNYDNIKLLSQYKEITIILCSESTKIMICL